MGFEIHNKNGIQLATFLFEHDRDVCFDLLNEDKNLVKVEK